MASQQDTESEGNEPSLSLSSQIRRFLWETRFFGLMVVIVATADVLIVNSVSYITQEQALVLGAFILGGACLSIISLIFGTEFYNGKQDDSQGETSGQVRGD